MYLIKSYLNIKIIVLLIPRRIDTLNFPFQYHKEIISKMTGGLE